MHAQQSAAAGSGLIGRGAGLRATDTEHGSTARPRPPPSARADRMSIASLKRAARRCRACPLWEPATQTVFGAGPDDARFFVVGEQAGDQEDLRGEPFVGPAGQLLDRALADAGIARETLYVTNVIKHFKFELRGKRRLHKRANAGEIAACTPWLVRELETVNPRHVVCLGAMAAHAILGKQFRLLDQRGRWLRREDGRWCLATVHPSFVLRSRIGGGYEATYTDFVADLRKLRKPPR